MIEKTQLIAKNEGIVIPRTIEEYTKRFHNQLPIIPSGIHQDELFDDDDEETDDDDETLDEYASISTHSQSMSRTKLVTNSEMKIALKSIDQNQNSSIRENIFSQSNELFI